MSTSRLLNDLQSFLAARGVEASALEVEALGPVMVDWFRFRRADPLTPEALRDVLVFRSGGWSEGCATGFKLSLLRRVSTREAGTETDWYAGITLLYDPARFSDLSPFATESTDWPSLGEFLGAVEGSAAHRRARGRAPMAVVVEGGGLR